jgi:hypothetical protein
VKFDAAPRRSRTARGKLVLPLRDRDSVARLVPALARAEQEETPAPPPNGAEPKVEANGARQARAAAKAKSKPKAKPRAPAARKKPAANGRAKKKKK